MVSFSEVRRPELRDGAWRMGCSVGALVAWTCLPMNDWPTDEDDEHNRWAVLEIYFEGAPRMAVCEISDAV